ncbi:MAG: riboflavin biosynthesis protein RibF [Oscillospiraceae bacterium]|nr:riboflavin biosynthesis protein RibF [Oscillospiraceae bacterium]
MEQSQKTAVALGLFDGVHAGHRVVLQAAYQQQAHGLVPGVFTFRSEMAAKKGAEYLYTTDQKLWLLKNDCGMELIYAPPFELICGMSGEAFSEHILCEQMQAAYVCCGADFRFGQGARCGVTELQTLGKRYGFAVEVVNAVCMDGVTVSSSEIRTALRQGDLQRANLLLGEPYLLLEHVRHGAQLGRKIGFPTANQLFHEGQLVPKYGVYVSRTRTPDGWYPSITNIGMKPTVHYDGLPLAETYIDGYTGDLYGVKLQVVLIEFLREERKFGSVEELTTQMQQDIAACR